MESNATSHQRVLDILAMKSPRGNGDLSSVIKAMYAKKNKILKLARKYPTPFYLLDVPELIRSIADFKSAFGKYFPECRPYYAVKSNHHPFILKTVVKAGFGLDVSSGRELQMALKTGCTSIVFSGPGKTQEELSLALTHASRVTIHLDSFGELAHLEQVARTMKIKIRAGVRIFSPVHGAWSKFGIPLNDLKKFWQRAHRSSWINLQGIQFHLSWNRQPDNYVRVIKELGNYLKRHFTASMRKEIRFVDCGGGYFPDQIEGSYPSTVHYPGTSPREHIIKMAGAYYGVETAFKTPYYVIRAAPLEDFARAIGDAVHRELTPLLQCEYYTEPGRIICSRAMHIVVKVVDKKSPAHVIADGGVNISGWEFGEHFYYPLLNCTHPSQKKELKCTVYGPLCTPHDVWGYRCYATKIEEGDVIVVPNQGAYRYVLAQNFIKEIPDVRFLL